MSLVQIEWKHAERIGIDAIIINSFSTHCSEANRVGITAALFGLWFPKAKLLPTREIVERKNDIPGKMAVNIVIYAHRHR